MAAIKILCVDDEAAVELLMRQYFRRKIRSGEYEFFFARNGIEALEVMYNNPDIEIILSDINMPDMDGLTLLAKVNEMRNPALHVIMVSAYGNMVNIRQAMNNGAFDFAVKPIDMEDLSMTIEKAIERINFVHETQQEHTQLESLKKDLTTARDIQQYILPQTFPPFPEESDRIDIYASMEAAKDIGGDFYDFFRIDDDRVALVIADVCGKGIPAALFMAISRTVIRSKGMLYSDTGKCMTESNLPLVAYSADYMFVTVFYAVYNMKTGLLAYCNAGHNRPVLLHSDGTTEVLPKPGNPFVGVYNNVVYKEDTLQMESGDTLVMYTDGVTEACNPEKQMFGQDRFCSTLSSLADKNCRQIIEVVKADISDFTTGAEQNDDITILALKRT